LHPLPDDIWQAELIKASNSTVHGEFLLWSWVLVNTASKRTRLFSISTSFRIGS
jgi:hypothetical protein